MSLYAAKDARGTYPKPTRRDSAERSESVSPTSEWRARRDSNPCYSLRGLWRSAGAQMRAPADAGPGV